ncbi:MAG: tetratricopeptide repeat protein, partial [Candidatus Omnitrophica bacterium]|nr:tetratricopeptide repeat protein [Candidatus Omnitrophota bacterium]
LLAITALALTARLAVADAWTARGAFADLAGHRAMALAAFSQAQQSDPWSTRVAVEQGVRLLKEAATREPGTAQDLLVQAREQFRRAARLSPQLSYAWLQLGVLTRRAGDPLEARRALDQAVRFDPNLRAGWWQLAHAAQAAGQFEQARRAAQRGKQLEPADPRWTFVEANALAQLQQADRALAVYRQLLGRFPRFYPAWFNLAELLRQQGQLPAALEAYRTFLSLAPASEQVAIAAATAQLEQLSREPRRDAPAPPPR